MSKKWRASSKFSHFIYSLWGWWQLLKDFKLRKSHQLECHNLLLIILITFIFVFFFFSSDVDALHDTCRCAQLLRCYFLVVAKSFILCSFVMSIFYVTSVTDDSFNHVQMAAITWTSSSMKYENFTNFNSEKFNF